MENRTYKEALQDFVNATEVYDSADVVAQWLTDHNIEHTREQRFEGLMGDYDYLRFDIWIESKRVAIEVDGQQHYRSCRNDSIEDFLKKRNYGRRKDWFCFTHGIFLMRIVYDELEFLDQTLGFLLQYQPDRKENYHEEMDPRC